MSSYYDVDAILTDAEKVPCTFTLDLPGLGFLDGNPGEDIRADQAVPLPLYLATLLAVQRLPSGATVCNLDLPPAIGGTGQLNALKADPRVVDLRQMCPHYYALATRMLELWEVGEIQEVIRETFRQRAGEIADFARGRAAVGAAGSIGGSGGDFLRGLDEMELQLFRSAREASRSTREWLGESKKK